jgi:hypothetical protein
MELQAQHGACPNVPYTGVHVLQSHSLWCAAGLPTKLCSTAHADFGLHMHVYPCLPGSL